MLVPQNIVMDMHNIMREASKLLISIKKFLKNLKEGCNPRFCPSLSNYADNSIRPWLLSDHDTLLYYILIQQVLSIQCLFIGHELEKMALLLYSRKILQSSYT